jgi:hypothetical protein
MYRSIAMFVIACALSLPLAFGSIATGKAEEPMNEFFDPEYGYRFKYPVDWKIQKFPEGQANREFRVMVFGPEGSSFMVIVELLGEETARTDYESPEKRQGRVEELMSQTIEHIYRMVSRNVNATKMTIGERTDLSNENALQFYISTLHTRSEGKPVIFAGIHAFPFAKKYSVNFVMTAFLDESKTTDNTLSLVVFNSFRLSGAESNSNRPQSGEERGR